MVAEKGVLSSPNPSEDCGVNAAFEEVKKFYLSDDISWVMPDTKGFVSVRGAEGTQEKETAHVQSQRDLP